MPILFGNRGTGGGQCGLDGRAGDVGNQGVPQEEPGSRNRFQRQGKGEMKNVNPHNE